MKADRGRRANGRWGRTLSNAAVILLLLAVGPFLVEILSFRFGGSWADRTRAFDSFFPPWLLGRSSSWPLQPPRLLLVQGALSILAFLAAAMAVMDMDEPGLARRAVHVAVMILSPLVVLFLAWQSL